MASTYFKTAFAKVASRQVENKTASVALQHVVLPIAIALLGVSTPYFWTMSKLIAVVLWGFILVFYFLTWWKASPVYDDIHGLLLQKQKDDQKISELNDENDSLQDIVEDLYFKNVASFALRAMSVDYIKNIATNGIDYDYFLEMIGEILAPFYLRGDAVFGFDISEKWCITIYIFDNKCKELRSIWRKKSNSHPANGMGRAWRPGEGHVGKAFLDRRPILTGNANDEAVSQLCRARGSKQLPYDKETYVSFASVPIAIADDDNIDPFGVLVVTSDQEDRFSEEATTELLMHAAETIAVILELSAADTSCITDANHDIDSKTKGEAHAGPEQETE
jgi:hypothetical protein